MGDTNRSKIRENSSETISSVILPWTKIGCRRRMYVGRSETGREVQPSGFFLCLAAVLIFTSSLLIIGTCVWAMHHKIPYTHLFNKPFWMDTSNFNLCGGLLGLLCCWLAWTSHDRRKNYLLLPLLILLLAISLVLFSIGTTLDIITRSKITFTNTSNSPKLIENSYYSALNVSLSSSMLTYENSFNRKYSWDTLQRRLKCCGVERHLEWMNVLGYIPKSCYNKNGNLYKARCIDLIAYDKSWVLCIVTGFAFIAVGIQAISMVMASYLYLKAKLHITPSRQLFILS